MRPILFNGQMVRALVDGRKTVTRRVIPFKYVQNADTDHKDHSYFWVEDEYGDTHSGVEIAPYAVGDVLWVREAWRVGAWSHAVNGIAVDYKADGCARCEWLYPDAADFQRYAAQSMRDAKRAGFEPNDDGQFVWAVGEGPTRWRPSIHMPKWACRIWLRVIDVRVERLQDITEWSAKAEGVGVGCPDIPGDCSGDWCESDGERCERLSYIGGFRVLWDSLVKDGDRWDDNPFVWVVAFERSEEPEGEA